jgi:hypothetical protein
VIASWYGLMLEEVIANNRNLGRHDKIENPRPNHHPLTVVRCYSLKEIHNVKKAIGPHWRAVLCGRLGYNDAKIAEMYDTMDDCLFDNGILNHLGSPD